MNVSTFFPQLKTASPRRISSPYAVALHIDRHGVGLDGADGAENVVRQMRMQRTVERLILGHNSLGDAGTVALFDYLRSEEGRRHNLTEVSLNSNDIGDQGLWAIARYLEDNISLRSLFLQNNNLRGEGPVMLRFTLAVNRSNLRRLSLTSNSLADSLSNIFFPNLSSPTLSELHLSICSLDASSAPSIISYLASPRSGSLQILKLNGNSFGLEAMTKIVDTLEKLNWSINSLEMHACSATLGEGESQDWKTLELRSRTLIMQNMFLAKTTATDALSLLSPARVALLHYGRQLGGSAPRLPLELVFHTLSFLAPSLSPSQRIRVFKYAASPETLPSLDLILPKPRSSYSSPPAKLLLNQQHRCSQYPSDSTLVCPECGRPRFIESIASKREMREEWLRKVGCDRFEPISFDSLEVPGGGEERGGRDNGHEQGGTGFRIALSNSPALASWLSNVE